MDEGIFYVGAVIAPLLFVLLGFFIRRSGSKSLGAMFPLIGAIMAIDFASAAATDGSLTVGYEVISNANSPITVPIYPIIEIPAFLILLCFAVVLMMAADTRRRGARYDGMRLAVKISLVALMVAVAAYILPGDLSNLATANLGNAGLNGVMGDLTGIMAVASFLSFAYILFVSND